MQSYGRNRSLRANVLRRRGLGPDRRGFLGRGTAAAAAAILPRPAFAASTPDAQKLDAANRDTEASLLGYLSSRGYTQADPAPLVAAEHGFNGGLRYDAMHLPEASGQMVVQFCSRIGDIAERHRPEVLPLFTIFHWAPDARSTSSDGLELLFGCLRDGLGLEAPRLGIVSIPAFETQRPMVENLGLDWSSQVAIRDGAEALEAGDGSGYWRRPKPAGERSIPTYGVYCWIGEGLPTRAVEYPVGEGWIEVADAGFDSTVSLAVSCGVERLTLASAGLYPSWSTRLEQLLDQIDHEVDSGIEPLGKQLFEESK